jgi:hypothetical protein
VSTWRDLFQAVLLKTNPPDLEQRVTAAQQAIEERMRELIQENIRASNESGRSVMRSRHSRSCGVRSKKTSAEPLDELLAVLTCKPPRRKREESERKEGPGC